MKEEEPVKKIFYETLDYPSELGCIIFNETHNTKKILDYIISSNYPYESCYSTSFNPSFLARLVKEGYLIMAAEIYNFSTALYECYLEARHHLTHSALFFDHIHTTKTAKKLLPKYELRFDSDFDIIVNNCIKHHGEGWLKKPLIESIKKIRTENYLDVYFVSFGLYRDDKLVAGEFGSITGRIYTSYSGYHDENNTGTVQMLLTAQYLKNNGFAFWDLGMPLEYKTFLGAKTINLKEFILLWRKHNYSEPLPGLPSENYHIQNNNGLVSG